MDERDANEAIRNMVEAGMMMLDIMRPILEMLEGYKRELESLGYNEELQAQMAADLHHMITTGIAANSGQN